MMMIMATVMVLLTFLVILCGTSLLEVTLNKDNGDDVDEEDSEFACLNFAQPHKPQQILRLLFSVTKSLSLGT